MFSIPQILAGESFMNIDQLERDIVATFKPFNPKKIILFGSISKKDFDEDSDVDLIIVYDTEKRFMDRLRELYSQWNIPKAVDILAYTPTEFEMMSSNSFFVKDALTEGKIIYEKP